MTAKYLTAYIMFIALSIDGENYRIRAQPPVEAQSKLRDSRAAVVARVAMFRRQALGDSNRISMCDAIRAVGDSTSIFAVQQQLYSGASLFAHAKTSCGEERTPPPRRAPNRPRSIGLDSIAIRGDSAEAYVTVRDGEHMHREKFSLIRPTVDRGWGVIGMNIYGVLRVH